MYSRSFSGATAVSSTNDSALASPFIAIDSPSDASRNCQMRAWSSGVMARRHEQPKQHRDENAADDVRGEEGEPERFTESHPPAVSRGALERAPFIAPFADGEAATSRSLDCGGGGQALYPRGQTQKSREFPKFASAATFISRTYPGLSARQL